jgi:hypothetical protein
MSAALFDEAWLALQQSGRLLDRAAFDALPEPALPGRDLAARLRDALATASGATRGEALGTLLDAVLEDACGLVSATEVRWRKGNDVPTSESETLLDGTTQRPRRIYQVGDRAALVVFVSAAPRLGQHRGRRDAAHVVEYLRKRRTPLGLLTNGRSFRLVHADTDTSAFVEWESDRFLEGDALTPALHTLRRVLSPGALALDAEGRSPLLTAIRQARLGQARLSSELGERVREAVELLLAARLPVLEPTWASDENKAAYDAACHFVMRLVVVFFAEARELLPVDSPVYHGAYGLKGLVEALERAGKSRRIARHQAWPRLLALFRLLHRGSPHPALVVPTYGGDLFRVGDPAGDARERALARIEDGREPPDDELVYGLLVLLTRTTERVKEGGAWRTVAAPVDFTELTSEYIGILYEGLLDYELHRAGTQPVVFLGIGDQPALPLDRLEAMTDKQLRALVEKAKVSKAAAAGDEGEGDEDSADTDDVADDEPVLDDVPHPDEAFAAADALPDDARAAALRRARDWAERAALAAKLVRAPRRRDDPAHRAALDKASKQLIARVMLPGELYVVRWGGTRKGAGTFYTRPQLTLPTARRTLEPLLRTEAGALRTPEEILALKVCDPAMGSGSFLVASLRVLTEAVTASLHAHARLRSREGSDLVRIECALLPEADRDQSADGVAAIVRRAVVEHCLYGVDLDPLAVELARVSLWVETLDRRLPFTFLDHKLRCGDALTGAWLDRFRDYPLLAWWRDSPDEGWRGVHHPADLWARALESTRTGIVEEQRKLVAGEQKLRGLGASDEVLHAAFERVRALYRQLREVPASRPDERAALWRRRVALAPELTQVKEAFDTWCALWFWPLDRLALAPRPLDLLSPSDATRAVVQEVAAQRRFFHWELEFPDVFVEKGAGFDAIVANPPWEIRKPSSKEFFSDRDPLYRSLGKQDALAAQRGMFGGDAAFEQRWLAYNGVFKDAGNFVRHAAEPFGDTEGGAVALVPRRAPETKRLHEKWKSERARKTGLSDPQHAFRHQGSADLNSYKLFIEQAHALLKPGGQLGLITPSGLYTDKGAVALRRLLLDRCAWRWLYGFENRNKVFDIDSRFKFAVTIAAKGGRTEALQAAFMRHDLDDWAEAKGALAYPAERVQRFSPKSLSVLEIRSERDLEVLTTIYANSVLLGDDGPDGWGIKYATEFHMTNDSKLFIPREKAEAEGYRPDPYGRWIGPDGEVLLPLYEGRMIGQFDFSKKGWVSGKGRSAVWRDIPWEQKVIEPQFLMSQSDAASALVEPKLLTMEIASATNQRTGFSALVPPWPAGHKTPVQLAREPSLTIAYSAIFNSFAFDCVLRLALGSISITWHVLETLPLPKPGKTIRDVCELASSLSFTSEVFGSVLMQSFRAGMRQCRRPLTRLERLRLRCILDALVAALYGLSREDLRWILRDCDHPKERVASRDFARTLDPKGFWRVDKDEDPELRHTVLTLVAFDALDALVRAHDGDREAGMAAFAGLNEGEGWMLPETLRLADHGLGHDARAQTAQPVASRLGPRFLDWQLAQTPEESWAECERHARAILGDAEFERRFGPGAANANAPPAATSPNPPAARQQKLFD